MTSFEACLPKNNRASIWSLELTRGPGQKEGPDLDALHWLKAIAKQDKYLLPRINKSLDALSDSKLFSTLDMLSGYWQVSLSPEA